MFYLTVICRWGASLTLAITCGMLIVQLLSAGRTVARPATLVALVVLAFGMTGLALAASAAMASPGDGFFAWVPLQIFATETWSGQIALVRLGLMALSSALLLTGRNGFRAVTFVLISAVVFLLPVGGHAVTTVLVPLSVAVHGVHVLSVLLWSGTVVTLGALVLAPSRDPTRRDILRAVIAAFSPVALGLVTIGGLTGTIAAYLQIGSPAALIGTFYGQLLMLKAFVLLGIALASAAWLRWSYLEGRTSRQPRLALAVEAMMCAGMLTVASLLSQSVPGRHDDIIWPLPFRIDWGMLNPGRDGASVIAAHLVFAAVMFVIALGGSVFRRWLLVSVTSFAGLLIGLLGLTDMFVTAYPTTFAALPATYSVDVIATAEAVFMDQCADCHGKTGHGDGLAMQMTGARAADLTAPHTGFHTAGDIYWWITSGFPNSVMEGVKDSTSEDERWDLVNYVRLLTNSARSTQVTGEVVPDKPLLPSIGFSFPGVDSNPISLRDLEGKTPVLLVIGREHASLDRFNQLEGAFGDLQKSGVMIVFVVGPEIASAIPQMDPRPGLAILKDDTAATIAAWSYYRRSRADPDVDDQAKDVGHMEFLIDRFGYVRAKWRADKDALPSIATILEDVKQLNSEPKFLPSPEEHVH